MDLNRDAHLVCDPGVARLPLRDAHARAQAGRLPRVEFVTLLHPILSRAHGFDAGGQTRSIGARRPLALRIGDRLATVPALASDGRRISTNHPIARFLERRHRKPPLLPTDSQQRSAVEEAERWANDSLQMDARRIVTGAVRRDPAAAGRLCADGRLGPLLYRHSLARRVLIPTLVSGAFAPGPTTERKLLAELPATLDRIDDWIANGILGARNSTLRTSWSPQPGTHPLPARHPAAVRGTPKPSTRQPAPTRARVPARRQGTACNPSARLAQGALRPPQRSTLMRRRIIGAGGAIRRWARPPSSAQRRQ
jgi:hypothetical protein